VAELNKLALVVMVLIQFSQPLLLLAVAVVVVIQEVLMWLLLQAVLAVAAAWVVLARGGQVLMEQPIKATKVETTQETNLMVKVAVAAELVLLVLIQRLLEALVLMAELE
jgi:hypothetical protein